jgi:hypothetical protein
MQESSTINSLTPNPANPMTAAAPLEPLVSLGGETIERGGANDERK